MVSMESRITFFAWAANQTQTDVCLALNAGLADEPFYPTRIHRALKAEAGALDEELIARCEEVLGERFDRPGTLDEWFRRRKDFLASRPPSRSALRAAKGAAARAARAAARRADADTDATDAA